MRLVESELLNIHLPGRCTGQENLALPDYRKSIFLRECPGKKCGARVYERIDAPKGAEKKKKTHSPLNGSFERILTRCPSFVFSRILAYASPGRCTYLFERTCISHLLPFVYEPKILYF